MNRSRSILVFCLIAILSLTFAGAFYLWLVSIQANLTLKVTAPSVIFVATFLGMWLLFNFSRLLFFQRKGIKGYKLRGKITSYFLLSTLGFIVIFGGLMFYLIFLIENTFLDKERNVAYNLLQGYRQMIEISRNNFEKDLDIQLIARSGDFPVIFGFPKGQLSFYKSRSDIIERAVVRYRSVIRNFFISGQKGRYLYIGNTSTFVIAKRGNVYFANLTEKNLTDAFIALKSNADTMNRLRLLKQYIIPVSVLSIFILAIPILIAAFFVSLFVAKNITIPIEEIVKGTKILADGNLDYKVKIHSQDEIGDLAYHFNAMATRVKAAKEQIKKMERLEAWQEMAKRLAHEVKNPLTPIKLSTERLLYSYETKPAEFPEILSKTTNTIINETKRLENLVNEFSKFARLPSPKIEHKDIIHTLTEVIVFFENAYPEFHIRKDFDASENGKVYLDFDESQIKQVMINIMNNAVDACADGEKNIVIGTAKNEERFDLSFKDSGKGIPPEARDKVFEPYFTTKPHGNGIGLAIAERIMLEHGGNIWFETGDGGTVFFLELPLKKENMEDNKPVVG